MPPVTYLWTVHTVYEQNPMAIFDQKAKLVTYLRGLPEIPYLKFWKAPISNPFYVTPVDILELLPDYVPPGEEPPVEE